MGDVSVSVSAGKDVGKLREMQWETSVVWCGLVWGQAGQAGLQLKWIIRAKKME